MRTMDTLPSEIENVVEIDRIARIALRKGNVGHFVHRAIWCRYEMVTVNCHAWP